MAISQKQKEDLLKFAGIVIGGVAAYKILFSKKKPQTVAAEIIETPAQVIKKAADTTEKTIKKAVKAVENSADSIKKQINSLEDKAIESYSKNDMKKGKEYEDKADKLYKKKYSKLFPDKAKKLKEIKKTEKKPKTESSSAKQKYLEAVNMTASELEEWSNTELSKKASLSREPINRNIELLKKNSDEWTEDDNKKAQKTISYLARAKKIKRAKKEVKDSGYTRNEISLKNWGYDVKK